MKITRKYIVYSLYILYLESRGVRMIFVRGTESRFRVELYDILYTYTYTIYIYSYKFIYFCRGQWKFVWCLNNLINNFKFYLKGNCFKNSNVVNTKQISIYLSSFFCVFQKKKIVVYIFFLSDLFINQIKKGLTAKANTIMLFFSASVLMVLILDGNSEHVGYAQGKKIFADKKNPICGCSRSNQMPLTDWISEIPSPMRNMYWVTILYKYYVCAIVLIWIPLVQPTYMYI